MVYWCGSDANGCGGGKMPRFAFIAFARACERLLSRLVNFASKSLIISLEPACILVNGGTAVVIAVFDLLESLFFLA